MMLSRCLIVAVCAMPMAACTQTPTVPAPGGGPVSPLSTPDPNDPQVRIYFDSNKCAKYVNYWEVPVASQTGSQKVTWTAYNMITGDPDTNVIYQVYFDPFVGSGNVTSNNGVFNSQPLKKKLPVQVDYKYTIVPVHKVQGKWELYPGCDVLDPRIRVMPN